MILSHLISLVIAIPVCGFLISLLFRSTHEKQLAAIALYTTGAGLLLTVSIVSVWMWGDKKTIQTNELTFYQSADYEFFVAFALDRISAVYSLVGSLLAFLVSAYSRSYMHREKGFKRFFNNILFFYIAYNITVYAANFETLFVGWEMLGLSSFLLISFYRERYLPARNALKVFSIYRIGDVGILLAMWASHHLWQENILFSKLNNEQLVHALLQNHSWEGIFISVMLLIAAAAKSAQVPFSAWLPRAMEGPTPSSAIFYGSLSIHFGVFLLLRTSHFWENQTSVRILIAVIGTCTSLVAVSAGRVQTSIKSQIGYSSLAQIGLIFAEVALGFETIALVHFAGNAFLRTYQLLVSPSIITYLVREQLYEAPPTAPQKRSSAFQKVLNTLFILSVNEWYLDAIMNRVVFNPLKRIGQYLNFITYKNILKYFIPAYVMALLLFLFQGQVSGAWYSRYLPYLFFMIGLMFVLRAFSERRYPLLAWLLVVFNHLWIILGISFISRPALWECVIYLSGVVTCGAAGIVCIQKLRTFEPRFSGINMYNGHVYEYPRLAFLFLLCCLGLMGFPITPTFIGEDLLFSHISEEELLPAFVSALSFIMAGIAVVRIYARLFLGPHAKSYHEIALKSG